MQRMLLISIFVISNILSSWKMPLEQAVADLARYFPDQDLRRTGFQQQLRSTLTLADLGYTQDETLQGVLATRSYTVNWPDAWEQGGGNSFTVEFSHSPILQEYSSLAVDWNGIRLGSILLTPRTADRGSLTVTLPDEGINPGFNQLRIVLYMGIYDDRCQDPDNPAIWATIHASSYFNLNYTEASPAADWSRYPVPVIDNSTLIENSLLFVLPDDPTPGEVNAAAMIAAKLGQLAAWRTLEVDTIQESALGDLAEIPGDVMYVGEAGRLSFLRTNELPFVRPAGGTLTLTGENGQPVPDGAGLVWMQPSQRDPRTVEMVVTGADEAGLLTAAKGLASASVYPRLQGELGVILSAPELSNEAPAYRQMLTFAELGYDDVTASGTRQQTLNFIVPLQMQWQVLTEATLELHFAHSTLLHQERSSLTVGINGSPVGSILLTEENANDGRATFVIPARMLEIGENRISVTTSIQLIDDYEDEELCDDEYVTEAWVVVFSDSQFNLPGGPASLTLSLRDYPFAFIGRPDLADMGFVIPDKPGEEVTDAVVAIAAQLGRSAEGESLYPQVLSAANAEAAAIPHQIIIGLPSENPAITALNDTLPLPFEQGTDAPRSSEQIAKIAAPDGSIGFVQATLGSDGNPRLVATGTNRQGVIWAGNALSRPVLMRSLEGDLAILDSDVKMITAAIRKPAAPAPTVAEEAVPTNPIRWTLWLAGGIFGATILILLIVLGSDLIKRRKVRKSYEPPTL